MLYSRYGSFQCVFNNENTEPTDLRQTEIKSCLQISELQTDKVCILEEREECVWRREAKGPMAVSIRAAKDTNSGWERVRRS